MTSKLAARRDQAFGTGADLGSENLRLR